MIHSQPAASPDVAVQTRPVPAGLTVDAIVIGRNEGRRLVDCLATVKGNVRRLIYVDSGSVDDSIRNAQASGAEVVLLDPDQPFTAARARNAGLAALASSTPDSVQFIDGDCTLRQGWITTATRFLSDNPRVAVVAGRRAERRPEASVFNRLCDLEWNTPVGPARSCGGDALIRYDAIAGIGGFRDNLIAGEEPEMCLRLRKSDWQIWRLDADMTWHDANMTKVGQWARRSRRAGHAFAEGAWLHGGAPERHWVTETRRAMVWGLVLPLIFVIAVMVHPVGALLLLAYPLQVLRLAKRNGVSRRLSWQQAIAMTLGKFPEVLGVLDFHIHRLRGRRAGILEYK